MKNNFSTKENDVPALDALKAKHDAIRMSDDEKANIKSALFDAIDKDVAAAPAQPILSPWTIFTFYTQRVGVVVAALLVLITPVAYASEQSLPGEMLYPIKTNINEEIVAVLTSEDKRDEYHQSLVTKRTQELKELIDENEYSEEAFTELALALEENVAEAIAASDESEEPTKDIIQDQQDIAVTLAVGARIARQERDTDAQGNGESMRALQRIDEVFDDLYEKTELAIDAKVTQVLALHNDVAGPVIASLKEDTEVITRHEVIVPDNKPAATTMMMATVAVVATTSTTTDDIAGDDLVEEDEDLVATATVEYILDVRKQTRFAQKLSEITATNAATTTEDKTLPQTDL